MPSTLKLLKVIVQPVFVLDDGENLTEVVDPAVAISAEEWPTYSSERFPRELAETQRQLAARQPPAPNRAQRRAAQRKKA